jgi:hydrogenase maturation protease
VKDTKTILPSRPRILVIGIGNLYRGDDAVGLVAARRLRSLVPSDVKILEENGEAATLMEAWRDSDIVMLLDAVYSGGKSGSIHRLDAQAQQIPRSLFQYSTHASGVGDAIELARTLNELPRRLIVCGIEGKSFNAGTQLSLEVEKAIGKLTELVLQEIRSVI